nr:type III PLP-dependent enzyme [Crossiella equi]
MDTQKPATPCLVLDLDIVRQRFLDLRAALPEAEIFYAVKACPTPEVVRLLVELGSCFDVASVAEIDLCLAQGARPEAISYGNTIKKAADIAYAHSVGVGLFVTDSADDLAKLAEHAPGAEVFCRVLVVNEGSRTPFGKKFGCAEDMALDLLERARELGLRPAGISFHVGSQQIDPNAWNDGIAQAGRITRALRGRGIEPTLVNLGGGFPARYTEHAPALAEYAAAIQGQLAEHFGEHRPRVLIEPGRAIAADAGIIRTEVVLVARKSYVDDRRWVYLDIGRYNGLAETEGEMITYRLAAGHEDSERGPVVLAGPTCDGDDVLYQRTVYELPLALRAGDHLDILSAGAYTASYASVEFNGFAPLPTYCV